MSDERGRQLRRPLRNSCFAAEPLTEIGPALKDIFPGGTAGHVVGIGASTCRSVPAEFVVRVHATDDGVQVGVSQSIKLRHFNLLSFEKRPFPSPEEKSQECRS